MHRMRVNITKFYQQTRKSTGIGLLYLNYGTWLKSLEMQLR